MQYLYKLEKYEVNSVIRFGFIYSVYDTKAGEMLCE
jgi:hypothetical protein